MQHLAVPSWQWPQAWLQSLAGQRLERGLSRGSAVPPGCQWCTNWIKAVTVKALRALALGNPALFPTLTSGAERNGLFGNVGGSGAGLGSLLRLQLWWSPAPLHLLIPAVFTAGKLLSLGHLGIICHGYSGKYKLKYPGGSQSYNLLGTFHISKMRVILMQETILRSCLSW